MGILFAHGVGVLPARGRYLGAVLKPHMDRGGEMQEEKSSNTAVLKALAETNITRKYCCRG